MANAEEQILKKILLDIDYRSRGQNKAQKVMRGLEKGADGVKASVDGVVGSIEQLAVAFGAASGIKKGLGTFLDLNKAMIQASAQFSKYGIGIGKVEKQMESLSKTIGITRQASLELFSTYEKGIPLVSIKGFENTMKNIVKITGASVSGQKEYLNLVQNISNKIPSLQNMLENISETDEQRVQTLSKSLVLTGQIDLATAKMLGNLSSANRQSSKEDKERLKRNMEILESQKRLQRVFEDLSIQIGKAILPYMESFSKFLSENEETISNIVGFTSKWAVKIGIAVASFKVLKSLISASAGGIGIIGKGLGMLSKKRGLTGRVAGYAQQLGGGKIGSKGTPVYVTNMPMSFNGGKRGGPGLISRTKRRTKAFAGRAAQGLGKMTNWGKLGTAARVGLGATAAIGTAGILGGSLLENSAGNSRQESDKKLREAADLLEKAAKASEEGDKERANALRAEAKFKKEEASRLRIQGAKKSMGGSGLKIAGMAATGAAIGSIVPVIGTALGGLIGTLGGLMLEFGNLRKSITDLIPGMRSLREAKEEAVKSEKKWIEMLNNMASERGREVQREQEDFANINFRRLFDGKSKGENSYAEGLDPKKIEEAKIKLTTGGSIDKIIESQGSKGLISSAKQREIDSIVALKKKEDPEYLEKKENLEKKRKKDIVKASMYGVSGAMGASPSQESIQKQMELRKKAEDDYNKSTRELEGGIRGDLEKEAAIESINALRQEELANMMKLSMVIDLQSQKFQNQKGLLESSADYGVRYKESFEGLNKITEEIKDNIKSQNIGLKSGIDAIDETIDKEKKLLAEAVKLQVERDNTKLEGKKLEGKELDDEVQRQLEIELELNDKIVKLESDKARFQQTIINNEKELIELLTFQADKLSQITAAYQSYTQSSMQLLKSESERVKILGDENDAAKVGEQAIEQRAVNEQEILKIKAELESREKAAADLLKTTTKDGKKITENSVVYKEQRAKINQLLSREKELLVSNVELTKQHLDLIMHFKEAQDQNANSQEKLLKSQIDFSSVTGKIDMGNILNGYDSVNKEIKKVIDKTKESLTLSEERVKVLIKEKASEAEIDKQLSQSADLRAHIFEQERRRQELAIGLIKTKEEQLNQAQLETQYAEQMVSLMDNLTVGIGASAAMKIDAAAAMQEERKIIQEQIDLLEKQIKPGEDSLLITNKIQELRNKDLSILEKQNSLVKSLRDGWVSAITAATNGQGKITKIMVNQEGNLAALQDRFSGIRSSMSGATMRAGDTSIGARQSQQFTMQGSGQGIAGISGGTGIGYMSDVDKWLGLDPAAMSQQMLQGQRQQVVDQFGAAVQRGIGTGESLGASGQNQGLLNAGGVGRGSGATGSSGGPATGGSSTNRKRTSGGIQINCTFHVNSMGEAITELSRKIRELQQQNTDLRDELKPSGGAGAGSR